MSEPIKAASRTLTAKVLGASAVTLPVVAVVVSLSLPGDDDQSPGSAGNAGGQLPAQQASAPAATGTGGDGSGGSGAGGGNRSAAGNAGSAGTPTAIPGGSIPSGSSDAQDSDSSGGGGASPEPFPPPGGLCGPAEFLGGLPAFIKALGSPDLLPAPVKYLTGVPIGPSGPVLGPIAGALAVPANVLNGFNDTYGLIAAEIPDECGMVMGDPHLRTLDGRTYDFQAVGEYWAARDSAGELAVQLRTRAYGGRASVVSAVAARVDGHEVVIDPSRESAITVDGRPLATEELVATDNGGAIIALEEGVALYWPDGATTLTVSHLRSAALWLNLTLDDRFRGAVTGLLGNADGDPENDLALPDGRLVEAEYDQLYGDFRSAWRVAEADLLFEDASIYQEDFPPDQPPVIEGREAAREICVNAGVVIRELLDHCSYDVAVSGETSFAGEYFANQRRRFAVTSRDCTVSFAGEAMQGGLGPARRWWLTSGTVGSSPNWTLQLDEATRVSRVQPAGELLAVTDNTLGLLLVANDGSVVQRLPGDIIDRVDPLVVGGTVFMATGQGLSAVNLDGSLCWQLLLHGDEEIASLGWQDGVIVATTLAAGGSVSVALAIDASNGNEKWSRPLQASVRQFGASVPPLITDQQLVFEGPAGGLVALDPENGEPLWFTESSRSNDSLQGLSLVDDTILVAGRTTGITAVDARNGDALWNHPVSQGVILSLAVGDGIAVAAAERGVTALDPSTGAILWVRDDIRTPPGAPQQLIIGDQVITSSGNRILSVLDINTGAETMSIVADLGNNASNANAGFTGTLVNWNGLLVVVDRAGSLQTFR